MELSERSKQIRRDSLKLGLPHGIYHWGGSFSVVEILIALYDHVLKPEDRVIMSKGHCWIPQVVILREKGLNPGFGPRMDNSESCLLGHPARDESNGIFANTGSLGHGLPIAIGRALGLKKAGQPGHVYVILGDGEIQEGTTWEGLLTAAHHKLDNLTIILDDNRIQGSGYSHETLSGAAWALWSAACSLGCYVKRIGGHDVDMLCRALRREEFQTVVPCPALITASTLKGFPISVMMDKPEWHARFPNPAELEQIYKELE